MICRHCGVSIVKSYADYTNGWTHEGGGVYCKITMADAILADTPEPKAKTMTCPGCGHEVYLDPMDGWRNDSDGFTCEPPSTTHSQHILEPKGDDRG